ncbi:MAG: hypothetical protein HY535_02560 [Chloroflexi bacterium]|nr:hypothetical protein [Chloroflexota bacterium]
MSTTSPAGPAFDPSGQYRIDPETLGAQGRSFAVLLLHRRCASCWGTLLQQPAQGLDIEAEEHLEQVQAHCASAPDFIHSALPVMETLFRILLASGNQPMTAEELHVALRERWADPSNSRVPAPEAVARLLSRDAFYGIRPVSAPEGGRRSPA